MLSVDDAIEHVLEQAAPLPARTVALKDGNGLFLAESVVSQIDSPPFDKSMMDGYAARKSDLTELPAELKVIGELMAGEVPESTICRGQSLRIMTGAPVPNGADCVVPLELTTTSDNPQKVSVVEAVRHSNIIPQGRMIRSGEPILKAPRQLRSQEIALLAEVGCAKLTVHPRPSVAVLATGDELVETTETPGPGQIRNSNEPMLLAQVAELGGNPTGLGIARDNLPDLKSKISAGLEHDMLLLTGGVSMGAKDLVPQVLEDLGVRKVFHRVELKPGKPVWFGVLERSDSPPRLIFGLPGNPVSSMVCAELFVGAGLRRLAGSDVCRSRRLTAQISSGSVSAGNRELFWPSRLNWTESGWQVTPLEWKGSADLRTVTDANCLIRCPADQTIVSDKAEAVSVVLLSSFQMTGETIEV